MAEGHHISSMSTQFSLPLLKSIIISWEPLWLHIIQSTSQRLDLKIYNLGIKFSAHEHFRTTLKSGGFFHCSHGFVFPPESFPLKLYQIPPSTYWPLCRKEQEPPPLPWAQMFQDNFCSLQPHVCTLLSFPVACESHALFRENVFRVTGVHHMAEYDFKFSE